MTEQLSPVNDAWKAFLTQNGAQWQNEQLQSFADVREAQEGPFLAPLVHQRLIKVTGPEAEKFLQGQLTCDLRRATAGDALLGAHCDHKGRMHSSFILAAADDNTFLLRLHESIAVSAETALKKYSVFSKVELSAVDDWFPIALFGVGAPDAGKLLPFAQPTEPGRSVREDGLVVVSTGDSAWELWAQEEKARQVWQVLSPRCTAATPAHWDLAQIEQGLAYVRRETAGELIPQMLNYQALDGISFKKGCYTGQEVVARLHYLGQAKKRLYRATVAQDTVPAAGIPVCHAETGKQLGLVAQAAASGAGSCALLVVCGEDAQRQAPVALGSSAGPQIQWQPLPYEVE